MAGPIRVLFLTHDYPFPVKYGGQVYTGNVIRELAAHPEVELAVHSYDTRSSNEDSADPIVPNWTFTPRPQVSIPRRILSVLPSIAVVWKSSSFEKAAVEAVQRGRYDYIVVDYIAIGWILGVLIRALRRVSEPAQIVYMSHNVEAELREQIATSMTGGAARRLAARYDARRAEVLERALVRRSNFTTAETTADEAAFAERYGASEIVRLSPGYDGTLIAHREVPLSETDPVALVVGGRLSTMKQLVLDALLEQAADGVASAGFGLTVAGPATDAYLSGLQQRYPDVTLLGYVKDIEPLLRTCRLGIVADHVGGGFKHRILTYVFHRVPIIATPESMAGLPFTAGVHYVPVDHYSEVPAVVRSIGNDFDELERIQDAAYDACFGAFSWPRQVDQFVAELGRRSH